MEEKTRMSRLELTDECTYQLISRYLVVDGRECVLELGSRLSDSVWVTRGGRQFRLDASHGEDFYLDPVTGAYGRRYLEDRFDRLDLWSSRAVDGRWLDDEGRVVVVTLPLSLAERLSLTEADMDDVSALGGVVEGTDCSITMKETKDGAWKISVRTGARVNATKACAALGGGGHRAASGCLIEHESYEAARAMILNAIAEAVPEEQT